ncbi:hypothetical protein NPX13_g8267 [Xylaria arbuscula]|uniref:Uncharacterized protein n=1 Tax=Xylaria arbuscula TaxID=114810 RepID=A0A9W8N927_9PEZI|nr:hypothetical protein NPX13_g8267 [Xylaria arbuscula]
MVTSEDPRTKFGLTCPVNGHFYICQDSSTKFIGCCNVDPCTQELDGECPESQLYNSSYSASSGVQFLPQGCADYSNGSNWYTCDHAVPPFLGCCLNNPCNDGCLEGNLVAATLSDDPENASQLIVPDTTATTATSPTSSGTGSSMMPAGTGSSNPSPSSDNGSRAGLIAGVSVAGVVVLLLVIAAYLWYRRRERARQKSDYALGLTHDDPSNSGQPNGYFQSPTPAEKNAFLSPSSNRLSHDPRTALSSPSISENHYDPHTSFVSELEGSSGTHSALYSSPRDTHNGFGGRS